MRLCEYFPFAQHLLEAALKKESMCTDQVMLIGSLRVMALCTRYDMGSKDIWRRLCWFEVGRERVHVIVIFSMKLAFALRLSSANF